MAHPVISPHRFSVDLEVLSAVGGAGNAVFLTSSNQVNEETERILEDCLTLGWRPMVITVDPDVEDPGYRPHEMSLRSDPAVIPGLLADRFHSGLPIHYLAIEPSEAESTFESLAALGIRPWVVRGSSSGSAPAGYRQVGQREDLTWWISGEQGHLSGGVAAGLGLGTAQPPDATLERKNSLGTRIRGRSHVIARRLLSALPLSATAPLVGRRHLGLVRANQSHLVDPAYLGQPSKGEVQWITPAELPEIPPVGLELQPLSESDCQSIQHWLDRGPFDSDAMLDRRMDNHGDELGRTIAALRTRLTIAHHVIQAAGTSEPHGSEILFDARSLQTPSFGTRGIGRFALAALLAIRAAASDSRIVLLVDKGLEILPPEIAGECAQITRVDGADALRFSLVVQPSPMTASPRPLLPALHSRAHKVAVVFDFIPAHYPSIYLTHPAARAEYGACLDALCLFDEFLCISRDTEVEMAHWLSAYGRVPATYETCVAWPQVLDDHIAQQAQAPENGPIVVMTGDEGRKNTFGALAAIGVATAGPEAPRDVRVVGMPGHDVRIHHWAIAAGLREGEAQTVSRLSDDELQSLLSSASAVVVASFDEGLSLPVIEAVRAGVPVIGSDIPTHRELIGADSYLAPAGDIEAMALAIRKHQGNRATHKRQLRHLRNHAHVTLELALKKAVMAHSRANVPRPHHQERVKPGHPLSIGVATPMPPQPTGVADFSGATLRELARLADVTVYTTSGAGDFEGIRRKPIEHLLAGGHDHDVLVSVVGNSHFHLPFVELLEIHDCVAVAHDTRMVEYYMALRSKGGAEQVMLCGQSNRRLDPSLDEQIDDMRLLQNAGLWEIARRAQMLILHSKSAAPRIAAETQIEPLVLPFANQRQPDVMSVTGAMRDAARSRLGFSDDVLHLATFGYVDIRTKMTDLVVEAAAWLAQWGHRVALHVVGSAGPVQKRALERRARIAGLEHFEITGFTPEATYRDYLLAIDLGIQLRISPLLGVSGPLSDISAFGTPALASNGLCVDVGAPEFVTRLPDEVSSLMVAEAVEAAIRAPLAPEVREAQRVAYLAGNTPELYARALLDILEGVAQA